MVGIYDCIMNYFNVKITISLLLLVSLGIMILEIIQTWQSPVIKAALSIKKVEKNAKLNPKPQKVSFYPSVLAKTPNLNEGYIFNEERYLPDPDKEDESASNEKGEGLKIDFENVMYNGSLIIGDEAKALLSYPEPKKAPVKQNRNFRQKSSKRIKKLKGRKTARKTVMTGDVIGGYRVTSIQPDMIVFRKGEERIKKMLNDPEKKRIIAPARKSKKTVKLKNAVNIRRRIKSRPKISRRNRKL
jgi:hypothetical protein